MILYKLFTHCFNNISILLLYSKLLLKLMYHWCVVRFQYSQYIQFLASTFNSNSKIRRRKREITYKIYKIREFTDAYRDSRSCYNLTLNNLTRDLPVNRYAKLFSVTVVKGATGEILDSWAPNGSQQQL